MKQTFKTLFFIILVLTDSSLLAQDCTNYYVPDSLIAPDEGSSRSGSCASPDGAMLEIDGFPADFYELADNGYCFTISPAKKDITVCYTFTATGTDIECNAGYSSAGCLIIQFNNFNLYTCAPSCTLVATGLVFSGLTPGTCYTWCFHAKCTGGSQGFDSICPYFIDNTVLPIELNYFEGISLGTQNRLNWQTLSELNNERFDVLRSADGLSFETIGMISGGGTTFNTRNYSFTDQHPLPGDNYYMLKQIDFDGNYYHSNAIHVNSSLGKQTSIIVLNNPGKSVLNADLIAADNGEGFIAITDLTGRLVYQEKVEIQKGINSKQLDISILPRGSYIISFSDSNGKADAVFIR